RYQPTIHLLICLLFATSGCATTQNRHTELLPGRSTYRTGPFVIHSHKPIRQKDTIVRELESLSRSVATKIGASPAPNSLKPVDVYILADDQSFRHFLQYYHPELPPRRAYFIATAKTRSVYTYAGDHLMEDLRHEATHAIVNLTHPGLPLWLDEGLAEYFEHPDKSQTPDNHQDRFFADIETGSIPDLKQLESVSDVSKMSPRNYREAWAWARWGLDGPPPVRQSFSHYLADIEKLGETESRAALKPLSDRWAALPESAGFNTSASAMLAWLRLNNTGKSGQPDLAASTKNDPSVQQTRLQNESATAPARTSKSSTLGRNRPGFFGRLRKSLFGS
ncbi:MAG: hypothetical protein ACKO85_14790, partial [Isosphaeraceae bacterium]